MDLVVIGGGPAGVTAALRARELGASVALVERGSLGGVCANDGCAPTRVLAKASRLRRDSAQFVQYGLLGDRPAVDWPQLLRRVHQAVYELAEKKQLVHHLARSGAVVYEGRGPAHFLDDHTIELGDGSRVEGDRFLLCAGGHARRLPIPGAELALTHSDVWTLRELPRSVVIVGAAATGCQLASVFNDLGAEVTLLEAAAHILPGEDHDVSEAVRRGFVDDGIRVETGVLVESIERVDGGLRAHWTTPEGPRSAGGEAVLMAVGWVGNADGLDLHKAGVETSRGYVVVDDQLRTSVPHIYAAGDLTGRMMLVQSAGHKARTAVDNALLGLGRSGKHTVVPHGGFTDPEYGSVGLTEEAARRRGDGSPDPLISIVSYADLDRAVIDGHVRGFCKLLVCPSTRRLLGAHVVGEQALETVHLVASGMAAGMTVDQLAECELAYPTYCAIVGLAARHVTRAMGLTTVAEPWRTSKRLDLAEWERKDDVVSTRGA